MLKTHKHIDLDLDGIEITENPMEDPLNNRANSILKLVDKERLQYGPYRNTYRFLMLTTFEDFMESYGPYDCENKIPRVPIQTVVCMRLATKIYWAWKEQIYNKR